MTVGLTSCPPEVIGGIVSLLDLTDVGSLRLASRCLRAKATQSQFRSRFRSKRVKVTGPGLERLAVVTQNGWLGCEISDLTLVGVVHNIEDLEEAVLATPDDPRKTDLETLQERQRSYEQLLESGKLAQILRKAFKNIATNNSTGKLISLSLELIVYLTNAQDELAPLAGGPWRPIWKIAAETARLVFSALRDSNLRIDHLTIFNSAGLHRCSIAGNKLSSLDYAIEGLVIPLHSLQSLSISVSERVLDVKLDDLLDDDSEYEVTSEDEDQAREEATRKANDERNFTGLASLIHACKNLKYLDIHHCRANLGYPFAKIPNERLFQRMAALDSLPQLEGCGLRGVWLTEDDLLAFLRRVSSSLRRFEMETVTMTSGTFESIFELLTAANTSADSNTDAVDAAVPFPNLQYLYFDTLRVGKGLVFFTGVGEPRYPTYNWEPAHGGNTLSRKGNAEVKKPIAFHVPNDSGPVGSPFYQQWLQDQKRKYGHP
ncbi:hypothetical protein BJX64DRAFT_259363 [Aspergillus heterothallicus]